MLRKVVSGFVVLALVAGLSVAGEKDTKAHAVKGTVKKVDAAAGTLTVTVKKKKQVTDRDFTVSDATKVIVFNGPDKQVLSGKDALKNGAFKAGARVAVVADEDGKVSVLRGGDLPTKKKKNKQ